MAVFEWRVSYVAAMAQARGAVTTEARPRAVTRQPAAPAGPSALVGSVDPLHQDGHH